MQGSSVRGSQNRRLTGFTLGIAAFAAALLTAHAGISASASSDHYQAGMQQLNLDLISATRAGYSESDLQPILDRQTELANQPAPRWPSDRQSYLRNRALQISDLRMALNGLEVHRLELLRKSVTVRIGELSGGLARDARLGVDLGDLQPLLDSAQLAAKRLELARTPADFNLILAEVGPAIAQSQELNNQQAAQLAAVEAQAAALRVKGIAGARQAGLDALAAGRNDATVAAFISRPDLGRAFQKLESTAARLAGTDLVDVALAAALMQSYRDQVHTALLTRLPPKIIVVSIRAQEMWVYWNGQIYINTVVTTGRPALPTDIGLMIVARKESPVHFISPFPAGSAYDYGSVDAKYAIWFQPTGEAIHDSWWRSWYGPGSNVADFGSHGCIGVPYGPIDKLFPWTDVGTPVVVIPGDGGAPAAQLAQKTYDDPYWSYHPLPSQQAPAQA